MKDDAVAKNGAGYVKVIKIQLRLITALTIALTIRVLSAHDGAHQGKRQLAGQPWAVHQDEDSNIRIYRVRQRRTG